MSYLNGKKIPCKVTKKSFSIIAQIFVLLHNTGNCKVFLNHYVRYKYAASIINDHVDSEGF